VLQELILRVTSEVTVSGGSSSGTLISEQPHSLVRNVAVEGGKSGLIKNADAAALYRLQQFLKQSTGERTALANADAQTSTPIAFTLEIDHELTGVVGHERDTLLKGPDEKTLDLVIDWGNVGDLITGGDRTNSIANTQAVLAVREFRDSASIARRYELHKFGYIEPSGANTTSTDFEVPLKGKKILRGVLVKEFTQASGVTSHTPVNTIINKVKLDLDGDIRQEWGSWDALRADNMQQFQITSMPIGYSFIDFMAGGRAQEINVAGYTNPRLIFDISAVTNGKIRVYPIEIVK
jgi:hypothetical protein